MPRLVFVLCACLLQPVQKPGLWTFAMEPNHSSIAFSVPIAGGLTKVRGSFRKADVSIVWKDGDLSAWKVTARIDAASVDTGIADRDDSLRGPKFFDVAAHPTIDFSSRKIEKRDAGYVAIGDLTIRGISRPVELPFTITGVQWTEGRPLMGVSAHMTVPRLDYGVGADWKHTVVPNFLGNDIAVELDIVSRRGKELE